MTYNVLRQDATPEDPLMTIAEISGYTRYSQETVRRHLRSGALEGIRTGSSGRGGNWRARRSAVHKWLGVPESGVALPNT
jgi:excisionase family DNA binding protein